MCELGATHMNQETNTKHKRYDEAFKKSAVEHWMISGKSARQVAAELGVNVQATTNRLGHARADAVVAAQGVAVADDEQFGFDGDGGNRIHCGIN